MSQQRRRPARTRAATTQRPRTARPSPPAASEPRNAQTQPVATAEPVVAAEPPHQGDRSGLLAQAVAIGIVVWLVIVVFAIMSATR